MLNNADAAELLLSLLFGLICVTYGYHTIQFVMVVFSILAILSIAKDYGVQKMASFYIALVYFIAFFVLLPYVPVRHHAIIFLCAKVLFYLGSLAWTAVQIYHAIPMFYISSMVISFTISTWIWVCMKSTERQCLIFTTALMGSYVIAGAIDGWTPDDSFSSNGWFKLAVIIFSTCVGIFFQLRATKEPGQGNARAPTYAFAPRPSLAPTDLSDCDLPRTPHSPSYDFVTVPYVEVVVQPVIHDSPLPDSIPEEVELPPQSKANTASL
ncbi:unnamed protein product [Aphanomyces euteiches]|uniref:Uncharacterized protein n=1 Tax=Aphanomyces euteiches TaxID=100861 RepID=A0A6G0W6G3_9STRA|nr:hypothetical protein Ae201684_018207 [Aphanomyces euteiches]KAH9076774.1 hypothetical protein Ae201684P_010707 [Aphanomyces euteiches]